MVWAEWAIFKLRPCLYFAIRNKTLSLDCRDVSSLNSYRFLFLAAAIICWGQLFNIVANVLGVLDFFLLASYYLLYCLACCETAVHLM